jgi:predicted ATP-binding protein involved in virulence
MATAKKRNNHKNKTIKHVECFDATMSGIHHWYKSMFERLGWMILAKHHGIDDKIISYKNALERLKCTIEEKIKNTRDYDKKADLKIMHGELLVLIDHANKDL